MRRIAVVGPSDSGRTTLGRWLEATLALPFTVLDDLHWRPGWVEAPRDEVARRSRPPHARGMPGRRRQR